MTIFATNEKTGNHALATAYTTENDIGFSGRAGAGVYDDGSLTFAKKHLHEGLERVVRVIAPLTLTMGREDGGRGDLRARGQVVVLIRQAGAADGREIVVEPVTTTGTWENYGHPSGTKGVWHGRWQEVTK